MAVTLKVATLVIKALVKPIAGEMKKSASNPGFFRETCNRYGQFHNNIMTRIQLRSMGHHVKKVKALPEDEAVRLGAEVFAEALVLLTGMSAIGLEVWRKMRADREASRLKELAEIEEKKARELRAIEKENVLRKKLLALEERMISVENAKLNQLHDKLVKEQLQHIELTEQMLSRVETLENRLAIKQTQDKAKKIVAAPLPDAICNIKHEKDLASHLQDVAPLVVNGHVVDLETQAAHADATHTQTQTPTVVNTAPVVDIKIDTPVATPVATVASALAPTVPEIRVIIPDVTEASPVHKKISAVLDNVEKITHGSIDKKQS